MRVVEEKINLDQNTSGVTKTAVAASAALSEFFSYTVPDKSQIIFNPTDFAYMLLQDGTGAIANTSRVTIEITDPMGRRTRVLADSQYLQFQEIQDITKKFFFGQRVRLPANFILKCKAAPVTNGIATANYAISISATLVYETLD